MEAITQASAQVFDHVMVPGQASFQKGVRKYILNREIILNTNHELFSGGFFTGKEKSLLQMNAQPLKKWPGPVGISPLEPVHLSTRRRE